MSYFAQTWKNWLKWLAVVTVFAIACGFLSNWQFHRREEKLVLINRVLKNYSTDAVPIDDLLPQSNSWSPDFEWRLISATGHFVPAKSVLVRNRPNGGTPGFEQLVPFVLDNGRTLLVSRGWLPTGSKQDYPDQNPLPSLSERTITVRLRPSEPVTDRTAPKGEVPNIEIFRVANGLALSNFYSSAYGRLETDDSKDIKLTPMSPPSTEEGNNFSYAIQWIAFAVMAFGALFWMIRVERDRYLGVVRVKKPRKRPSDEEIEDSL